MTEAEASEKRQREFAERSKMFEEELDVDETLSQLLVAEGFSELEEVAYIDWPNWPRSKASTRNWPKNCRAAPPKRSSAAKPLTANSAGAGRRGCPGRNAAPDRAMLVTLGKAGIKTLDDLADLATDELIAKKRAEQRRRDNSAAAAPQRCARRTRAACWANMA
jgi:N utilization substance protein A